jgi:hypothetical protein
LLVFLAVFSVPRPSESLIDGVAAALLWPVLELFVKKIALADDVGGEDVTILSLHVNNAFCCLLLTPLIRVTQNICTSVNPSAM